MQKPSIGRFVHAVVDPRINNNEDVAPALITRVVEVDGDERLNLRVFLDTGADLRLTNVELVDKRPETSGDAETPTRRVAFWPPRN